MGYSNRQKITNYTDLKNVSLKFPSIKDKDFNYRINIKKELYLNDSSRDVSQFKEYITQDLKYYRFKKRLRHR